MAKSLRSKSKRSFRSKKRESGKYAAVEAARLNRLHAKLAVIKDQAHAIADTSDDGEMAQGVEPPGTVSNAVDGGEGIVLDDPIQLEEKPAVSTHGPRGSRREEWRVSKGMDPIPKRRGMNRQGGLAARRKAGRPSRRR